MSRHARGSRCSVSHNTRSGLLTVVLLCGFVTATTTTATAQDLEPRAFSPAPVGLNFALLAYGYSSGNVFFDTSQPIKNAEGTIHSTAVVYVRTLSFFGASIASQITPYIEGSLVF